MSLTITILVQIDRRVTPNGRAHWATKKRITDELKSVTHWTMREAVDLNNPKACFQTARWPLTLDFVIGLGHRKKVMDHDNAIASMKPIIDQIASCIGIDDRHFRVGTLDQERDPSGSGFIRVIIKESQTQ